MLLAESTRLLSLVTPGEPVNDNKTTETSLIKPQKGMTPE
jgi:hypothetical protein